jgi:integrase
LRGINKDAYQASKFAYTTASRLTATLEASTEYINKQERTILVFEKSNRRKKKRRLTKYIRPDLWEELDLDNIKGKLFKITAEDLNALLRQAYKEVIPELEPQIPMPFHFWRHQFAQHMLRETDWNYGLVARLGHWTVETLEKYYGKMDRKTALEMGRKHALNI